MSVDRKKLHTEYGSSRKIVDYEAFAMNDTTLDVLDLSQIKFDNDETWLYQIPNSWKQSVKTPSPPRHQTDDNICQDVNSKAYYSKHINTQTFTRPKKRIPRPNIEKCSQEIFGDDESNIYDFNEAPSSLNEILNKTQTPSKPLEFDLTVNSSSSYFSNIAANTDNEEIFQNMSPPSLVNSMCSSTFTNLMESSFIKDDPVLKQICDTDFTTSILSQCSEPPSLIQSLNYGINSMDEFFAIVSQDESSGEKLTEFNGCSGDASFIVHRKESTEDMNTTFVECHDNSSKANRNQLNHPNNCGTYRKSNKLSSATFRKTDYNRLSNTRNHTYEIDPKDVEEAQNATLSEPTKFSNKTSTIVTVNNETYMKDDTIVKDSCNNILDGEELKDSDNDYCDIKNDAQKSMGCSTGSVDSLDRMSTLSSSSRSSNKFLNMEEVEAIAEKQEKSLPQSTPKPNCLRKINNRIIWDGDKFSPIVALPSCNILQSDSGDSSDDYKNVKSTTPAKYSNNGSPVKQTRSLVSLQDPSDVRKMKNLTLANRKHLYRAPSSDAVTDSQKTRSDAPKIPQTKMASVVSVTSNLKTMKRTLKGSYTSLKPVNSYLPIAPPINAPSDGKNTTYLAPVITTQTVQYSNSQGVENNVKMSGDGVFLKPTASVKSGLPKRFISATSIPRPVSKIPGLKRFNAMKQDEGK